MRKAGIVGFGRFGELLAELSRDYFDVYVIENDSDRAEKAKAKGYKHIPFDSLGDMDFIFLAVPISSVEDVIIALTPLTQQHQVVIDLCSVKVHPAKLMRQHLKQCQTIASHPMFGPDSAKGGLQGLQVALCPLNVEAENLRIITDFWAGLGAVVIETTPEAHDKDSVYSQAFTYSLVKIILGTEIPEITLQTKSFKAISEVAKLSARDSEQLFHDMLFYNPYFGEMKAKLEASIDKTRAILNDIMTEQNNSRGM